MHTTVSFSWPGLRFIFKKVYKASTTGIWENPTWDITKCWKPLLACLIALAYALYILAYPPKYRKLSIFLLALPVAIAFLHQSDVSPNYAVSDTFGRFLYIWLAHMSLTVTIIEFRPPTIKDNSTWRTRLRAAYKVLFCISPESELADRPRNNHNLARTQSHRPRHTLSRTQFLLRHAWKATYLFLFQYTYWALTYSCVSYIPPRGDEYAIFFRRLPDSLATEELWQRFDTTFSWCITNMCMYEAYHSCFAIFFVGLGFDAPGEWNMALFGSVKEAWTVRRYWGKHWHSYIYASFSGHTKVLTRKWLGLRPGRMSTRLIENTIVFGASGVMHSLVRWVQDDYGVGAYWYITFWYLGQMLPITVEGIVQEYWHAKKKELGIRDSKELRIAERVVGYVWVVGWNSWSIAKYVHTRQAVTDKAFEERLARREEEKTQEKTQEKGREEL